MDKGRGKITTEQIVRPSLLQNFRADRIPKFYDLTECEDSGVSEGISMRDKMSRILLVITIKEISQTISGAISIPEKSGMKLCAEGTRV